MTTGLCLAGSGSRGIVSCGYLLALRDLKVDYDKAFASSSGLLNGLLSHAGEFDKLVDSWLKIQQKDVYIDNGFLDVALCYGRRWVHDSSPLRKLIEKSINYPKLLENPRELWINTTDLTNGAPYSRELRSFKSKEDLITFSLASASPPIFFPTVKFEDKELCDAGVINNYSVTEAINADCDRIIVLLPVKPVDINNSKNILQLVEHVMNISMHSYLEREVRSITKINKVIDIIRSTVEENKCSAVLEDPDFPRKIKLIMVYPENPPTFDLLDFSYKNVNRQSLIDYGYHRCKQILEAEL